MNLLPTELESRFKEIGSQEDLEDPIVIAKFFFPGYAVRWYAIAYFPEDRNFFGYVTGLDYDEFGYFSLDELENLKHHLCDSRVVRDILFDETPISKIILGLI